MICAHWRTLPSTGRADAGKSKFDKPKFAGKPAYGDKPKWDKAAPKPPAPKGEGERFQRRDDKPASGLSHRPSEASTTSFRKDDGFKGKPKKDRANGKPGFLSPWQPTLDGQSAEGPKPKPKKSYKPKA